MPGLDCLTFEGCNYLIFEGGDCLIFEGLDCLIFDCLTIEGQGWTEGEKREPPCLAA